MRLPARCCLATAVLVLIADAAISGQSLGEVARREAERRKQVPSGRVYTNGDLAPADPAQTVPAPAATAQPSAETAKPGSQTEVAAAAEGGGDKPAAQQPPSRRSEQYWRDRAKGLRGRLAQLEADAAAAERRLNEIDAGSQTPETARERELLATAVTRLQSSRGYLRDEVAQFEKLAELNKIPADWIR
jgi:hypothetical protein